MRRQAFRERGEAPEIGHDHADLALLSADLQPTRRFKHGRDHLVGEITSEGLTDEFVAKLDLLGKVLQFGFYELAVGDVGPGPDDLLRLTFVVVRDGESVLDPDVMSVPMAEAIFQRALALGYQAIHFREYSRGVFGMQALDPEFLVVAHLPGRVAHDRIQILADEGASIVAGNLCRIDNGRTSADERLEIVHQRHSLA